MYTWQEKSYFQKFSAIEELNENMKKLSQQSKDKVIKQQKDKKGELLWSLFWFPVAGITNTTN